MPLLFLIRPLTPLIRSEIELCSLYRLAIELIQTILQQPSDSHIKSVYLTLILVHLNLKPVHRIQCIIMAIERNVIANNYVIAQGLYQVRYYVRGTFYLGAVAQFE